MKSLSIKCILALLLFANTAFAADSLSSWNDTAPKKAIVAFVDDVTNPGSRNFVPVEKRIATFDNDGTLWAEQPIYFEWYFVFDRIKTLASQHPEWIGKKPFASVLKGDLKSAMTGGDHALLEMMMATHSGMTTDEFEKIVIDWLATARHPKTKRLYTDGIPAHA